MVKEFIMVPNCQYGGVPVVTSKFDSNTYWEVESGLSFVFSLYNVRITD